MVTLAGCQKEENNTPASQTKTVEFFANSIQTKTHFADKTADKKYPTLWDAGDKVKVLMNLESPTGISGLETSSAGLTASDILNDGASARFKVELNDGTPDEQGDVYTSDSYTYYAVVPSSAYNARSNADGGRVTVIIPANQTPQPNALDKACQIIYAVSETYPSIQDAVSLDFKHFTAYGKFSLTNLTNQISTIKTVALKFDGVNIAGKWNYYPSTDTKGVHEAGSNTITLTTSSATDIWFACAPVDVSGKNLKVIVTDVQGKQLVKEITMPADRVFESGKVSTFTVNMSGIVPPVQEETTEYYQKVTEAPSDWSGKYLIVFGNNAHATLSGKDLIATTTVIISDGRIASSDVITAASMTVTKSGDKYRMTYPDGKYFSMAKNSSGSSNTAFDLTFDYTAGGVKISGVVSNVTYVLHHNSNRGDFYRCYADKIGQNGYTLPSLYKFVENSSSEGGETPEQPTLTPRNLAYSSATATATVGQAFTAPTLSGTKIDDVTYSSSNTGVATVNNSGVVTILAAGTTTITASALATNEYEAGTASYTLTVSAAQGGEMPSESVVLLSEDFSTLTSWSTSDVSSLTVNGKVWTRNAGKMYAQNGCVKFGTSTAVENSGIKLPKLTSISGTANVRLTFKAVSSAGAYTISVESSTGSVGTLTPASITKYSTSINNGSQTANALKNAFAASPVFSVDITGVTSATEITIKVPASAKQWYIDDVKVVTID